MGPLLLRLTRRGRRRIRPSSGHRKFCRQSFRLFESTAASNGNVLSLAEMSAGEIRQASDGWHVLLRIGGVEHRLWLKEPPVVGSAYAAELPFDEDFEIRAHAARRLWRALNGRAAGPAFHELSPQRRQRLALALRALDAQSRGQQLSNNRRGPVWRQAYSRTGLEDP